MSRQKFTLHEWIHRHHLTRGVHFESGILSHYQAFNSAVEKNPHPSHTWDTVSFLLSLLELVLHSLRLPLLCCDSTYSVLCYPRGNIPGLTTSENKDKLPRAEISSWAATQASKPGSWVPCSSQGLAGGHCKHVAGCCCARASDLKGMLAPAPFPCSRNSLQQAVHARRVPPVAIDGDLQVRVVPVIPQDQPDPARKARLQLSPQAAYSTPQLSAGISVQELSQQRESGTKAWIRGSKDWKLRFSDHLLLVFIGEQNELVLWKPSDIKATTSFKLVVNLSLSQPWPASDTNNQGRGMMARSIFPRKILENVQYWDISEFGNTIEALLIQSENMQNMTNKWQVV